VAPVAEDLLPVEGPDCQAAFLAVHPSLAAALARLVSMAVLRRIPCSGVCLRLATDAAVAPVAGAAVAVVAVAAAVAAAGWAVVLPPEAAVVAKAVPAACVAAVELPAFSDQELAAHKDCWQVAWSTEAVFLLMEAVVAVVAAAQEADLDVGHPAAVLLVLQVAQSEVLAVAVAVPPAEPVASAWISACSSPATDRQ